MKYRENMRHWDRLSYIEENFKKAFPNTTPGKMRTMMKLPPLGTKRTTLRIAEMIAERLGER